MVDVLSIVFIVLFIVVSISFPIACLVYFKRTQKISWKPILIGLLVFIVFSQVLKNALQVYMLDLNSKTAEWLSDPLLLAIFGSLAAGVFEEVGRFIGFRFLLKKYRDWKDGIAYGVGHGGIEMIFIGGMAGVQSLVFAFLINSGSFDELTEGGASSSLMAIKDQLVDGSWAFILAGSLERIFAFAVQLGLSLLVLYAIRSRKMMFVLYAILIHAAFDFIIVVMADVWNLNLFVIEGTIFAVAVLSVIFIIKSKSLFAKTPEA